MWPRRKKSQGKRTRVFFATDLHGSTLCFRKFLSGARVYEADLMILGGDLAGKELVPLLRESGGVRPPGGGSLLERESAIGELLEEIENRGGYPVVCERDELEELRSNPELASDRIMVEAAKRLERWVELAADRLADGPPCYATGGNDDPEHVLEAIPPSGAISMGDGQVVELAGHDLWLAGMGWSNPTPWHTPREEPEEALETRIRELLSGYEDERRMVFNFHVPPRASGLDRCPELDTSTDPPTPVRISGQVQMHDAGSDAVRAAIEEYRPLLALHGHIHESRASASIGRTLCLNPGSTYSEGVLQAALIVIDGDRVNHQFTTG